VDVCIKTHSLRVNMVTNSGSVNIGSTLNIRLIPQYPQQEPRQEPQKPPQDKLQPPPESPPSQPVPAPQEPSLPSTSLEKTDSVASAAFGSTLSERVPSGRLLIPRPVHLPPPPIRIPLTTC
jgi:hypothetical protein